MQSCVVLASSIIALVLLPAGGNATEVTSRERGDLAIHARDILSRYCHQCHGGKERKGNFDALDYPKIVATGPHPVPFVVAKDVAASQMIQFIEDGAMPPGNLPRPSLAEITLLKEWINAGAPAFPVDFQEKTIYQAVLNDLAKHAAHEVPYFRYLSLSHLVRAKLLMPELAKEQLALEAALLAVGGERGKNAAVPIDPTATLYRLDLRALGWDNRELFYRVENRKPAGIYPLSPYDLLLLEYPHAMAPDNRFDGYFTQAGLAAPIPILRGDWVAQAIMNREGVLTPLGVELASLTKLSTEHAKKGFPPLGSLEWTPPCGLKPFPFGNQNPVAAAPKPLTDRTPLPLTSWYAGDVEPAKPAFSLTAEIVDTDGKPLKTVKVGQSFRLNVTIDRPVRYRLFRVESDGSIVEQETSADGYLAKSGTLQPKPVPPDSLASFRIVDIPNGNEKATEYFVLLAALEERELPPISIVRSRHAMCDNEKFPISRFLIDLGQDLKHREWAAVRRVVPITVTQEEGN